MEYEDRLKSKITPQQALNIIKKEGMDITLEEAEKIVSFLYKLSNIQVRHFLEKNADEKKI